jgi:uncharacterized protein
MPELAMSLSLRVTEDLKTAMKAKDTVRLSVLRAIRGEVLKQESAGSGKAASDDDVVRMVKTLIKQRQESCAMWRTAGRADAVAKDEAELAILQEFLPAGLSSAELAAIVQAAIASTGASGAKDMGKVMKAVMQAVKDSGKDADGKEVSAQVKQALGA